MSLIEIGYKYLASFTGAGMKGNWTFHNQHGKYLPGAYPENTVSKGKLRAENLKSEDS